MDVMPGYKQTEVGVIPEDWEVATAAQVCELVVDCKNRTPPVVDGGEFAVVRTPNVRNGKFVREDLRYTDELSFGEWTARAVPQVGDILITREAPLGEVCLVPSDLRGCLGQRMMLYRPDREKIDPAFMLYALMSSAVQSNLLKKIGGSTVGHAKVDDIRNLQIPLPPTKTEQQAIAEVLSDADALIESLEQLIAKKCYLKQGAMQELLRPKDEWEATTFGAITYRIVGGGTPSRAIAGYWNGDIPWMTVKDFANHMPSGTLEYITRDGLKNSASNLIPKCTIITSTRMALGKAVIFDVDVAINQDLKAIFPCKGIETRFLYYWFQFNEPRIAEMGSGSTVMGISLDDIRRIHFAKPSQAEQKTIANILSDLDAEIAALEAKLAKARLIKQGMMHNLLTGTIRLATQSSKVILFPKAKESKVESVKPHNWQINEAVIISVLAKHFGSKQFPLGRKRYTKLSYLLHRHMKHRADGYLKKAAGPYNPDTKYKGPEKIAQENGYIRSHKREQFTGFIAGETISKAEDYFSKWYGNDVLAWLEQFRFKTNDELGLLATVDMAMEDLRRAGQTVNVEAVKRIIQNHPEWEAKLQQDIFSDANIVRALQICRELFA